MLSHDSYLNLEKLVNEECIKLEQEGKQIISIKVWEDIHGCPTASIIYAL